MPQWPRLRNRWNFFCGGDPSNTWERSFATISHWVMSWDVRLATRHCCTEETKSGRIWRPLPVPHHPTVTRHAPPSHTHFHQQPSTSIGEDEAAAVPSVAVPSPIQQQPIADSLAELGSQWINGVRRSSRFQTQMGTVYVNGLRRSARLQK